MKPASILLAFLFVPLGSVPPDVIPEGMRHVALELKVDPGPFTVCQCRSYTVRSGDTLSEIARRECGAVSSAEEIRLLNRRIDFDKLPAGEEIVIPPRTGRADSRAASRATDAAAGCWVLFENTWYTSQGDVPFPILDGQYLPFYRWKASVLAVSRDNLLDFLRTDWKKFDTARLPDGVAASQSFVITRLVPDADPTTTIETRIVLKEGKDRRPEVEIKERCLDKDGKVISDVVAGVPSPRKGAMELPLVAVAILAVLAVVGLARRRRAGLPGSASP